MDINGKTALVTGGSKGIGYSVAELLVREGANVAVTSRHQDEVEEAAQKLSQMGPGRAIGVKCNVRDMDEQTQAVQKTVDEFGSLDVLIANAGVGRFAPIDEMSVEEWHDTVDTNLTGAFYSVKAAVEELKKAEGYIINISSLAGKNAFAGGAAYNASKFGLKRLFRGGDARPAPKGRQGLVHHAGVGGDAL